MNVFAPVVVYLLCLFASLVCAGLLTRSYLQTRSHLMLWTALSFGLLAANNLFLVADMLIYPDVDFLPLRRFTVLSAIGVQLYGFISDAR